MLGQDLYDLVIRLLNYDPGQRITASGAINHVYWRVRQATRRTRHQPDWVLMVVLP